MEQEIANYNHFNTISHKDIIKRLLSERKRYCMRCSVNATA